MAASISKPQIAPLLNLDISTRLLYGIVATDRSFYIGLRKLVKREHCVMLATRITGNKLPRELVDTIEEALYQTEIRSVERAWDSRLPRDHNILAFELSGTPTLAEQAVEARLLTMGVSVVRISISKPELTRNNFVGFVHLSASKRRPAMESNLSHQSPGALQRMRQYGATFHSLRSGRLCGISRQHSSMPPTIPDAIGHVSHDWTRFTPISADEREAGAIENRPGWATRLTEVSGLEDAMANWDARALKDFVELLELTVVSGEGDDRLKPCVHIHQAWREDS